MVKRIFPLAIVLYLMLFVTGCKQVMLDPEVDLLQMGTVALLEFDNLTSDLGIAREATVLLADELSKIEGLALLRPVLGDNRYSSRAAQEGRIQKIATDLGADTLLSGAVTYYFEDVYLEPPKRVLIDKNKELYKWQARQESSVEVVLSMQLLSKNGKVLYSRQETGKASRLKNIDLPWPEDSEYLPTFTILPSADRRQLPALRQEALRNAIKKLASSYLPHYTFTW